MNTRRIRKDFIDLCNELKKSENSENKDDITIEVDRDYPIIDTLEVENKIVNKNTDIKKFSVLLRGPKGTPYQGGLFRLCFDIDDTYPFKPPKVRFDTQIYHPNVKDGAICLDIIGNTWSPLLSITKVILSISSLLAMPNEKDPLNAEAGAYIKLDIEQKTNKFVQKACAWTKNFAIKDKYYEYLELKEIA
jgi:ubiquitin-protein ligase